METRSKDTTWKTGRRRDDNIKVDLQEVGWENIDWIGLTHDRDRWLALVSAVTNLRVSENVGNFLTGLGRVSFSVFILLKLVS